MVGSDGGVVVTHVAYGSRCGGNHFLSSFMFLYAFDCFQLLCTLHDMLIAIYGLKFELWDVRGSG